MTRILIVEDNPDISAGVSDFLTEHGFSVSCSFQYEMLWRSWSILLVIWFC